MAGSATCPLCGGSDSAPQMLLRCNNHTLKRMHINLHHHTVSRCGEEISKGKLGSTTVAMDACNTEKLSDLGGSLNPQMTMKETFLTEFSQHNKAFQLDIKAVQMAC